MRRERLSRIIENHFCIIQVDTCILLGSKITTNTIIDETWVISPLRNALCAVLTAEKALEGPDGFFDGEIPGIGNVAMGICKWPTKSFERECTLLYSKPQFRY
jgi:hypothetical protein